MISLFQAEINFKLNIASAARAGCGTAATAPTTLTPLAKDIVEEVGIR